MCFATSPLTFFLYCWLSLPPLQFVIFVFQVPGYKPRILAVNPFNTRLQQTQKWPARTTPKLFNQRLFWFFTMIGLTFPYRVWFERHCDYLRVVIIKEVSSSYSSSPDATNVVVDNKTEGGKKSSWFSIPKSYSSYWTSSSTQPRS